MRARIWLDRTLWFSWWAGTALIVLSWTDVVSNEVGWVGFGASAMATLLSTVAKRYWRVPHAHVEPPSDPRPREERVSTVPPRD